MKKCIYKLSNELIEAMNENLPFTDFESLDDFIDFVNIKEPHAIFLLSMVGQINNVSINEWFFFLKEAAEMGSEDAVEELADFYEDEDSEFYNPKEAIKLYKKIAPKGNLRANYQLGIYCFNEGMNDEAKKYMQIVGDNCFGTLNDEVAIFFENVGDYEKAIKYYKSFRVFDENGRCVEGFKLDEDDIPECVYGCIAFCYYKMNDFSNANLFINKGAVLDDPYCLFLKGLIYYKNEDKDGESQLDKATKWFIKASDAGSKNASLYLGKIYSNGDEKYDVQKALYYFDKAGEFAECCQPLINALKLKFEKKKKNAFLEYIDNFIELEKDNTNYQKFVENDLKKDFGIYWERLSEFTKKELVTGITTFVSYRSMERKNNNSTLDYSPVIISISRGLESELKRVFFDKYLNYLKQTNANPNTFKRLEGFTYFDNGVLRFTKNDHWFTLGKLKFMVNGVTYADWHKKPHQKMDCELRKYCMKVALNKSYFSNEDFEREEQFTQYMCELSSNVSQICSMFRNESAHANSISSKEKAIACIDWVIKVKQLLIKFMERLDYESLKRY